MVSTFDELFQSVSYFATRCTEKLRKQGSLAQGLYVFAYTNRCREDLEQYFPSQYVHLPFPTADTSEIIEYCRTILEQIFDSKYQYKKAGVILSDIMPSEHVVLDLFDTKDRAKQQKLNSVFDSINHKFGQDSIKVAINTDNAETWKLKREYLSKNPSTNLRNIIEIKV